MNVRLLQSGDPAIRDVERMLEAGHGRNLDSWGTGGSTLVLGGFEEEELVAFGIFRDYRDPALHVGSQVDLDRIRDILEMREVALYQIALLHAEEPRARPQGAAEALIVGFEKWLTGQYERYCLFITLLQDANRLAGPLYRRLGFKKAGRFSSLMRFDLKKLKGMIRMIPPLPDELEPRFFDEAAEKDLQGFSECYRQVFLEGDHGNGPEVARALSDVTAAPEFSRRVSLLLLSGDDSRVVGFMLADRPEPDRIHIGVAGLLPEVRGNRLPYRCLPPIARRALEMGVEHATFVTTQGRVARLTLRAFGAREVDRLQTFYKVG